MKVDIGFQVMNTENAPSATIYIVLSEQSSQTNEWNSAPVKVRQSVKIKWLTTTPITKWWKMLQQIPPLKITAKGETYYINRATNTTNLIQSPNEDQECSAINEIEMIRK